MRLINSKQYSLFIKKSQQTINNDVFKRKIDYVDLFGTIRFITDEDMFHDSEFLTRKEVLSILNISLTTAKSKNIFNFIESIDVDKKRFLKREIFNFMERRKVKKIEDIKGSDFSEIDRLARERRKRIEKELRRRENLRGKAS